MSCVDREGRALDEQPNIRINDPAFAKRLANLLVETRRRRDLSLDDVIRLAGDRLSRAQLKDLESGTLPLTEAIIETAASVYGADLAAILPERLPVTIEPGVLVTGGITRSFDPSEPDALLTAYLKMVRGLRHEEKAPVVDLRRADIQALAGYLHLSDERVLDRLLVLMGATRARRLSMAVLLASGVAVIGLAGGAAALAIGGGDDEGGDGENVGVTTSTVAATTAPTTAPTTELTDPTTTVLTTTTAPRSTTVAPTAATVVTTSPPATVAPNAPATTVRPAPGTVAPPPTTTAAGVGEPPVPPTTTPPPETTTSPGEPLPTVTTPPTTSVDVGLPPLPPSDTATG